MKLLQKTLASILLALTLVVGIVPTSAFADCSGSATWIKEKFPDAYMEYYRQDGKGYVRVYNSDNTAYKIYHCEYHDNGHCFICD